MYVRTPSWLWNWSSTGGYHTSSITSNAPNILWHEENIPKLISPITIQQKPIKVTSNHSPVLHPCRNRRERRNDPKKLAIRLQNRMSIEPHRFPTKTNNSSHKHRPQHNLHEETTKNFVFPQGIVDKTIFLSQKTFSRCPETSRLAGKLSRYVIKTGTAHT